MNTRARNRVVLLSAGLVALAGCLSASLYAGSAIATETPTPSASTASVSPPAETKTTFTIGLTQDIDSTNPFAGIAAASYEIYQLIYDQLMKR